MIDQHKKHMARVCNLYQERVTSIKTVLFLIVASVTVPTQWRAYQHKIMTTTAATDENQEKTIQNKLKVLQLTNITCHLRMGCAIFGFSSMRQM